MKLCHRRSQMNRIMSCVSVLLRCHIPFTFFSRERKSLLLDLMVWRVKSAITSSVNNGHGFFCFKFIPGVTDIYSVHKDCWHVLPDTKMVARLSSDLNGIHKPDITKHTYMYTSSQWMFRWTSKFGDDSAKILRTYIVYVLSKYQAATETWLYSSNGQNVSLAYPHKLKVYIFCIEWSSEWSNLLNFDSSLDSDQIPQVQSKERYRKSE